MYRWRKWVSSIFRAVTPASRTSDSWLSGPFRKSTGWLARKTFTPDGIMLCAHSRVTCFRAQVGKLSQITGKFSLNCFCDQLLCPRSQQIRQCVRDPVSTRKINNVSHFHGGVSPWVGVLSRNNNSTRYAANLQTAETPDSVITLPVVAIGVGLVVDMEPRRLRERRKPNLEQATD